ncbi:hypothetical protein M0811_02979 [Anaeramoeba ignava]|uniref:Uncharacterized protein n=1 Tax=Anaeramoeba ignava TaxID=1746090 RepID=A0A9Q0L8K8_ANAIG|nr:hypothetical protein M0811_02979 [Anaeramoeba ignava]
MLFSSSFSSSDFEVSPNDFLPEIERDEEKIEESKQTKNFELIFQESSDSFEDFSINSSDLEDFENDQLDQTKEFLKRKFSTENCYKKPNDLTKEIVYQIQIHFPEKNWGFLYLSKNGIKIDLAKRVVNFAFDKTYIQVGFKTKHIRITNKQNFLIFSLFQLPVEHFVFYHHKFKQLHKLSNYD